MVSSTFNLNPPPGFRDFSADIPVRVYHRHLPHWRQAGATYFVTFRLADSIPQQQLLTLKRWRKIWERQHPEPRSDSEWKELALEITRRSEAWMDEGYGECVLRHPELAKEMSDSLLRFQDQRYMTTCFTVMPNHVHCLTRPFDGFELEDILEGVKGRVSRRVNAHLGRRGPLWQRESYDRIIRNVEHLYHAVQYIGRNAARAGLPRALWVRWVHPEWEKAGWGFVDDGSYSPGPFPL